VTAEIKALIDRFARVAFDGKPRRISVYRVADRDDPEEPAKHFTKVLEGVKAYAVAFVDDTADSASLGVLNKRDLTKTVEACFSDLIGEVSGALINAAGTPSRRRRAPQSPSSPRSMRRRTSCCARPISSGSSSGWACSR
jgi:hypothetical protein